MATRLYEAICARLRPEWHRDTKYHSLLSPEDDQDSIHHARTQTAVSSSTAKTLVALLCVIILSVIYAAFRNPTTFEYATCERPALRREWRDLDAAEKTDFLRAVTCLAETPSVLTDRGSMYDDMALVHRNIGARTHMLAPFFPWHRLFIHIFERLLEQKCDYHDPLPYWDWTLDWQNITASPVFDTTDGFGGNGDENDERECVKDGPLKAVSLLYGPDESYDKFYPTHCLTRFFRHYEDHTLGSISGYHIRPESVHWISEKPTYDEFRNATEVLAHNSLHWGFHGDFSSNAAANDPIFYIHHVQLDRLWWKWQQTVPGRQHEYYGTVNRDVQQRASIEDVLSFGDLWDDTRVVNVMSTMSGLLCYTYET